MKIGELARLTHCQVETIRYYEREGLLAAPERSEGNYRVYDDGHVERLTFIRNCRGLDMTLDEIRSLLALREEPRRNCAEVNSLIDAHIDHVQARITSLQALQAQLVALRGRCNQDGPEAPCSILQRLNTSGSVAAVEGEASHVGNSHAH